jgi:hypothetical protein
MAGLLVNGRICVLSSQVIHRKGYLCRGYSTIVRRISEVERSTGSRGIRAA